MSFDFGAVIHVAGTIGLAYLAWTNTETYGRTRQRRNLVLGLIFLGSLLADALFPR